MNTETQQFISWCITKGDDISSEEMAEYIEDVWGVTPSPPTPKGAPRWSVGRRVQIPEGLGSHNNDETRSIYAEYEGQEGEVIETHVENPELADHYSSKYEAVKVRFENGDEVILPEAQKGSYIAIKSVEPDPVEGPLVELVYIKDPDNVPTKEQIKVAREYVRRGEAKGEERSYRYYSGPITGLKESRREGIRLYFKCQQRNYELRSINPSSGQLLYIGTVESAGADRPAGWKDEYFAMVAEVDAAQKAGGVEAQK